MFKAILPKKFNARALTEGLISEVKKFSREAKVDLLRPTSMWSTSVLFTTQMTQTRARIRVVIFTEDERYRFLDQGTRVRFATMTSNFSPKTRPNSLLASSGSGSVSYVDRNRPHRGIQARSFAEQVKNIHEPKLVKRFGNTLRIGVIKSGHAI